MIDAYFWPTPNGWKITIALEEMGLDYRIVPVNIGRGAQFEPDFLAISPNNRMPAIVDHEPPGGGAPLSVFESGAILLYLAEKTGRFLTTEIRARTAVLEWLMWQMGGLGPMLGQAGHFHFYALEDVPYGKTRYRAEMERLYGVLDRRLDGCDYIAGAYSIADMACWPWVIPYKRLGVDLNHFPNVKRWYKALQTRPALRRGYEAGRELGKPTGNWDAEARKYLLPQNDPG
ncbi:MAG: thiol:disulfide oxidoreductase [Alphaproteobacteria bacterium]|nr:thiol:disulfide oxidoreductase [Alphaproteobacteria bacterium]